MKKIISTVIALFIVSVALPVVVLAQDAVARAQFTSAIDNREPVDELSKARNDIGKVYFFTELLDLEGQTITHRWEYQGQIMAEVSFNVGGPRWRVNSSKNLMPDWTGEWQVVVVNQAGEILVTKTLTVTADGMDHSDMENSPMNDMDQPEMGGESMDDSGMSTPGM